MAVGSSSSATSPGATGLKANQDLERYFAWDSGEATAAATTATGAAKVRRRTIGISLGKFGLDLTTQDVVLDLPTSNSFEEQLSSAGLRDRATSRPIPDSGRTPTALDAKRGLSAYARNATAQSSTPARTLGTV